MVRVRELSVAVVIGLVVASSPGMGATPGQQCAATKTKEAGKKLYCKAKCDSKGVKTGIAPDAVCLATCGTKFAAKWAKAEAKGGCATVGDEAAIEAKVDAHLQDLEALLQLGGPSVCSAAKYKESGKKAYCRLNCHAKAKKKGIAVDPLCLQKCADKFLAKCTQAEGHADCLAPAACATLETMVDAFVDDVVAALPTVPTTTTTSTTSSTTTSTAAPTTTTTTTTLPLFPACPADPSRTIYAGDAGSGACQQFDGNQTLCEQAFHQTQNAGEFASCFYAAGSCRGCGPSNRDQGQCINTCVEGPTPTCPGDPTRTTFAGFAGTTACRQFDGDQSACEAAFHMSGQGVESSCWWDVGASECRGCGANNQANGDCVNTCPICLGDPTRTIFVGGPDTGPCHVFDGDQASCEQAFHVSGTHVNRIASCYYDPGSNECRGCGNHADPATCSNACAVCPNDPTRTHVPGHGACHFFDGAASSCAGAFVTPLTGAGPASCEYDAGTDECFGCGPENQASGLCVNACEGPICGDNQTNQAWEECDGTDDGACSGIGLGCRGDCRCERCTDGSIDPGEACDTPGVQGACPAGTTCNINCTACLAVCGDGQVGGSEVCDPGLPGSCPAGESCLGCTACLAVCGDGQVGGSEVCDPPGGEAGCAVGEICDQACSACLGCPTPTIIGSAGGVFVGSTTGAFVIGGSCGGSIYSPERYFQWTPDTTHVATIKTCGGITNYDSVLYIRQGGCGGPVIACNDDFCGVRSQVSLGVVGGTTYTIVVDGYYGAAGNFTLTVSPSGAFLDPPLD